MRSLIIAICKTASEIFFSSFGIVLAAQYFFGNKSLDIFGIGKSWAGHWSKQKAESHFILGRKIGHLFYKVAPPPPPPSNDVWFATAMAIGMLAVFSTVVSILSYPVQNTLGFQQTQLEKLRNSNGRRQRFC